MTKPYENMKTEKRRAKVGERILSCYGSIGKVHASDEETISYRYLYGNGIGCVRHDQYEVLIEPDTEALQKEIEILRTENAKLRDNIHLLQNRLDNLREDHAASEDHLCERVGRERKLAHSLMDYIRGLEVGVK